MSSFSWSWLLPCDFLVFNSISIQVLFSQDSKSGLDWVLLSLALSKFFPENSSHLNLSEFLSLSPQLSGLTRCLHIGQKISSIQKVWIIIDHTLLVFLLRCHNLYHLFVQYLKKSFISFAYFSGSLEQEGKSYSCYSLMRQSRNPSIKFRFYHRESHLNPLGFTIDICRVWLMALMFPSCPDTVFS